MGINSYYDIFFFEICYEKLMEVDNTIIIKYVIIWVCFSIYFIKMNKIYNWDLSICNKTDLMCDWEFMNKELIKDKCEKCLYKALCLEAVDLIKNWHRPEATDLLDTNIK